MFCLKVWKERSQLTPPWAEIVGWWLASSPPMLSECSSISRICPGNLSFWSFSIFSPIFHLVHYFHLLYLVQKCFRGVKDQRSWQFSLKISTPNCMRVSPIAYICKFEIYVSSENPFVWINLSATPSHWKVSHVLVEWFCISPKEWWWGDDANQRSSGKYQQIQ